jgi:hypothetical protein
VAHLKFFISMGVPASLRAELTGQIMEVFGRLSFTLRRHPIQSLSWQEKDTKNDGDPNYLTNSRDIQDSRQAHGVPE